MRRWQRIVWGLCVGALIFMLFIRPGVAQSTDEKPSLEPWQLRGILAALEDRDPLVWSEALNKLSDFDLENPQADEAHISDKTIKHIAEILIDTNNLVVTRSAAASALGSMGDAAADQAKTLATVLVDDSADVNVRYEAARALGRMGDAAADQAETLATVLVDDSAAANLRSEAAFALGSMGEAAADQAAQFRALLRNQEMVLISGTGQQESALHAADALSKMGPLDDEILIYSLNSVNLNQPKAAKFRFLAYYLSEGREDSLTLIQWLGVRDEDDLPDPDDLSHKEAHNILQVFADAWLPPDKLPRKIRHEWPRHIANIVDAVNWTTQDLPLLRKHYQNLRQIDSTHAAAVAAVIAHLEWWRGVWIGRDLWLTHITFWLLLIFVYPRSPQIQAIFFWNPWVRRITGLGYVGFLLTWIPFLRARLFAPFQDSLLADAGLPGFSPRAYFPDSLVKHKATGEQSPLQCTIPAIKSQLILEGESGLGKTMFLRHVIQNTLHHQAKGGRWRALLDWVRPPRIMVFLPAERCAQGVSEAIQAKLLGLTQDPNFLRDLIYSGAIDICIDGLNEVTADTRAKITEFVERYFKGNVIMTTQPLEWRPPATATTYVLQPLPRNQVSEFLCSREPTLAADATVRGSDYLDACNTYLQTAFTQHQPKRERVAAQRILSNPMDLSIVAQMISQGKHPDLFQLQAQQYALMATDYERLHLREFPLGLFSECVYDMRLRDQTAIPEKEFFDELQCMERHKMVTCRQDVDNDKNPTREWNFRHDKIMEFFIVQTFLGSDNNRPQKYLGDPRFRGVYFLLANLMPLDDALVLREQLINYAADTRDHTLSDDFIQRLRPRKTESMVQSVQEVCQ